MAGEEVAAGRKFQTPQDSCALGLQNSLSFPVKANVFHCCKSTRNYSLTSELVKSLFLLILEPLSMAFLLSQFSNIWSQDRSTI